MEISIRAKILRAQESLGPLLLGGMLMDLSVSGAGVLLFNMSERDFRHIARYRATKMIKLQFHVEPDPVSINISGSIMYLDYMDKGSYTACSVGVQFDESEVEMLARIEDFIQSHGNQAGYANGDLDSR